MNLRKVEVCILHQGLLQQVCAVFSIGRHNASHLYRRAPAYLVSESASCSLWSQLFRDHLSLPSLYFNSHMLKTYLFVVVEPVEILLQILYSALCMTLMQGGKCEMGQLPQTSDCFAKVLFLSCSRTCGIGCPTESSCEYSDNHD